MSCLGEFNLFFWIQAAEKSRWGIKGGPQLRAAAARWLWFSPATLGAAAAHANQLLREFALGPGAGAAAAAAALLQLLPQEVSSALEQVRPGRVCVRVCATG